MIKSTNIVNSYASNVKIELIVKIYSFYSLLYSFRSMCIKT